MFIKKIELENIKKFEHECIEFKSGINFISGKNGAGKTTLIESIGYAIFGATIVNKNFTDYMIRKGKKSGKIIITFLDKNNEEYIVERKISKTVSTWVVKKFIDDEENVIATGNHEVPAFFKEHLEFERDDNMQDIYNKIVSVPQGQMTSVFFETDTSRKAEFDPIFNLDTYRKAYDKIKLVKSIEKENHELEINLSKYEVSINKKNELKSEEKETIAQIKEKENELNEYKEKNKNISDEFNKLEEVKRKLDLLNANINTKNAYKEKYESLKEKYNEDLKIINESEQIINKAKDDYDLYLNQENKIKDYEEKLKIYDTAKKEKETLINENEKITIKIDACKKNQEASKSEINIVNKEIQDKKEKVAELEKSKKELINSSNSYEDINKINSIKNEINKLIINLSAKDSEIKNLLSKKDSNEECILNVNNASNKIKKIISISNGEINELAKSANLDISKTIENLTSNSDGKMQNALDEKDKILKEIDSLIKENLKDENLIKDYLNDVNCAANVFNEYYDNQAKIINEINSKIEKAHYALELENKELNKSLIKIEELNKIIENSINEIKEANSIIKSNNEKILSLKQNSDKFDETNNLILDIKEKQRSLKKSYEIYMQNIKKIDNKEKLVNSINENEESLTNTIKELDDMNKQIFTISKEFDQDKYNEYSFLIKSINENAIRLESDLKNLNKNLNKIKVNLDEIKTIEEDYKKTKEEIKINNEIIKVIEKLRVVIKESPEAICDILIQKISDRACEIYSEIATDTSRLEWEKNYELVLFDYFNDQEIRKEFKQLSGGEQMSAALSIRLAMLEKISKLKIGILDEPTINIDAQRREKLASVVYTTSQKYNQIFVVSHDDTFEYITENIVELTGGSNE